MSRPQDDTNGAGFTKTETTKHETPAFMKNVDNRMRQALSDSVFPGAVLLVAKDDSLLFHEAYGHANLLTNRTMSRETVFDLASLTKPLATTLALLHLIHENRLTLACTLAEVLPPFGGMEKGAITIRQLLSHTSGYPDYRPFFESLRTMSPETRVTALRDLLIREPLAYLPGQHTVYSDLGFMVLRWVVETLTGQRLDRFLAETVYSPLGIEDLFFIDLDAPQMIRRSYAATEQCPWRKRLIEGAVHDDNAFVVGGIEGHAGLFGTAQAVFHLLRVLMSAYRQDPGAHRFDPLQLARVFTRQPDSDRALGFDMPAASGSSSGRLFSARTVGHLGFTGTSFWMDLDRSIIVILLTNRVHPTRANEKIKRFRPIIHDMIMQCLLPIRSR